jgi:hypothetical protein
MSELDFLQLTPVYSGTDADVDRADLGSGTYNLPPYQPARSARVKFAANLPPTTVKHQVPMALVRAGRGGQASGRGGRAVGMSDWCLTNIQTNPNY